MFWTCVRKVYFEGFFFITNRQVNRKLWSLILLIEINEMYVEVLSQNGLWFWSCQAVFSEKLSPPALHPKFIHDQLREAPACTSGGNGSRPRSRSDVRNFWQSSCVPMPPVSGARPWLEATPLRRLVVNLVRWV